VRAIAQATKSRIEQLARVPLAAVPVSNAAMRWLLPLVLIAAIEPAAQDTPDFSGTWVLEQPAQSSPQIARTLVVRQPVTRTNVFGQPMPPSFFELDVERQFDGETRSDTYRIGVEGGTVRGALNGVADQGDICGVSRWSVRWEDSRLHIRSSCYTTSAAGSDPSSEHDEVWELEDGRLIIRVVDRRSGSEATPLTLKYRRRVSPSYLAEDRFAYAGTPHPRVQDRATTS
jgi:hypothetical protein